MITSGQFFKTVTSVKTGLNHFQPIKPSTYSAELSQLQRIDLVLRRMEHFFPAKFSEYVERQPYRFTSVYSTPAWWKTLEALYHMADGELFGVDWYVLALAEKWNVNNATGWRESMPQAELFLHRLPIRLYGFCECEDNHDIANYPPLYLMRGLLSLEWRTADGSAAWVIDRYDLGEEIKQLARTASIWEMWQRLNELERDPDISGPALIRSLASIAGYATSNSGNPLLDRCYLWHERDPVLGKLDPSDLILTCGTHDYFPWTWHPDSVREASLLWQAAHRVTQAAYQLTRWCERDQKNLTRFARFILTGEGKEVMKNDPGLLILG